MFLLRLLFVCALSLATAYANTCTDLLVKQNPDQRLDRLSILSKSEPKSVEELYRLFIEGSSYQDLSFEKVKLGLQIEVGPERNPICSNCIYVDCWNHMGRDVPKERFVEADVSHMPFENESVSFVVSLAFP